MWVSKQLSAVEYASKVGSAELANELAMRANEQMDKREAYFLYLDS